MFAKLLDELWRDSRLDGNGLSGLLSPLSTPMSERKDFHELLVSE